MRFATAQYNLGVSYRYGTGVARDAAKARAWFARAAAGGDADAAAARAELDVTPP